MSALHLTVNELFVNGTLCCVASAVTKDRRWVFSAFVFYAAMLLEIVWPS